MSLRLLLLVCGSCYEGIFSLERLGEFGLLSIFRRCHADGVFEAGGESRNAGKSVGGGNFLYRKECGFQLMFCFSEANLSQILLKRNSGFAFEKVSQAPGRQVDRAGNISKFHAAVGILLQENQNYLNPAISWSCDREPGFEIGSFERVRETA